MNDEAAGDDMRVEDLHHAAGSSTRITLRPEAALTSQTVSLKMRFVGIGLLALVCFLLQAVAIVPHAFHWSSAEVKIPGSFFGVQYTGVVVDLDLNFDLWRESTEIAGEKDEKNLDEIAFFDPGGCDGDGFCEDHRGARQTAQWLTTVALFLAALACFPILVFARCQSTQVIPFSLFLGLLVVASLFLIFYYELYGGLSDDMLVIRWIIFTLAFLLVLGLNFKYALGVSIDDDKEKSKVSAGLSAALALGGVLAIAGAANYESMMASAFDNFEDYGWEVDSDTCKWGCFLSIGGGAIAVIVGAVGVGLHVISPPAGDATKVADSEADPPASRESYGTGRHRSRRRSMNDEAAAPSTPPAGDDTRVEDM